MTQKKVAFLFPGQGSQFVGMGRELYENFEFARTIFDTADQVLERPLTQLCFEGPESDQVPTSNQQPLLYTVSMAALAVLQQAGISPSAAAGHSLGEYGALACADVFSWQTGLRLVALRGRAMQEAGAANPGAMAAVMATADVVREACNSVEGQVGIVNFNAPEQNIISGDVVAVDAALANLKAMGVRRAIKLPVSSAFHSPLMTDAVSPMTHALMHANFENPKIPVVSNVTADVYRTGSEAKDMLAVQITGQVRWVDSMNRLASLGCDLFIEVGPGKVLAGLAKRINPDWTVLPAGTPAEIEAIGDLLEERMADAVEG